MFLKDKVAVVCGAGSIGGAPGRSAPNARVFVGARTAARSLAVDALDEDSVGGFVDAVVAEAGRLDLSFD